MAGEALIRSILKRLINSSIVKISSLSSGAHPRSAVGYFEPGHYCFIVVDGRQDHSHGLTISELAKVFEELGCKAAYNLDGGATAVMLFNNEIFSHPSNGGRNVGDILFIAESAATAEQEVTE